MSRTGDSPAVSEGDLERLREAYAAFNADGVEALLERLAPEIHVQDRESQPDRATYHGLKELEGMFRSMMEVFEHLVYELEELTTYGDEVVAVVRQSARGRGSGAPVESQVAHVWRMRDGAVVGLSFFGSRQKALAAVGASDDA